MSDRSLTRREFEKSLGMTVLGSSLLAGDACSSRQQAAEPKPLARTAPPARFEATRGTVDLTIPPSTPRGEIWRYGLAYPFQVAPGRAILFVNIRGNRGHDFEIGTDAILFDNLSTIRAERALPVSRNHEETNPRSNPPGKPSIM